MRIKKRQWIDEQKNHRYGNQGDEDFASILAKRYGEESHAGGHGQGFGHQKKNKVVKDQKVFTDEEWEYIFLDLLKQDKIDVSDDFYDENILFTSPEELMEIFS